MVGARGRVSASRIAMTRPGKPAPLPTRIVPKQPEKIVLAYGDELLEIGGRVGNMAAIREQAARAAVQRSLVLLRNDKSLLPLP